MKLWNKVAAIVFISIAACSEPVELDKSSDILDSRKMAKVLADVQLVESVGKVNAERLRIKVDSVNAYASVFQNHKVSAKQFKESMEYYSMFPDTLELIYERTLEHLSEKQASLEAVE